MAHGPTTASATRQKSASVAARDASAGGRTARDCTPRADWRAAVASVAGGGRQERGLGPSQREALAVLDPELEQRLRLALALDALGDDRRADAVGEGLERARVISRRMWLRVDVAHELAVGLEVARVQLRDRFSRPE